MTYVILCEGAKLVDYKQLKREIIDYAHSIGIDSIGFTTADPFDELKQKLESYHSKGFASGFEESEKNALSNVVRGLTILTTPKY